jgi:hypothetical protein
VARLELPGLVSQERDGGPVGEQRVDFELGSADHEVRVHGGVLHPFARRAVEHVGDARAVGDVAGGVLVEGRVVEGRAGLPDPRAAVHERELAEVGRACVARELGTHHLGATVGLDADDRACLEGQPQPFDELAVECERQRRADGPLGATAVRRREDLLRRHVRDVLDPGGRTEGGGHPARRRKQADGEVGSRPPVAERVGAQVVETGGTRLEPAETLPPGGGRIGLVEAHAEGDLIPEPRDVGLAEDLLRPPGTRGGDDAPVHRLLAHLPAGDLRDVRRGEPTPRRRPSPPRAADDGRRPATLRPRPSSPRTGCPRPPSSVSGG